jgi:hypothetical protein
MIPSTPREFKRKAFKLLASMLISSRFTQCIQARCSNQMT